MRGGLYIHIPFCVQKCLYCDFPSVAGAVERQGAAYVAALVRQVQVWRRRFPAFQPETVFIGGGTPSLLSAGQLGALVAALAAAGWWQSAAERTIEANPGTVALDKLQAMHGLGLNRISFGVQSFSDTLLQEIGRLHTAAAAVEAVELAAQAGFRRINLDLMYGLPGQTLDDWSDTLARAVRLPVDHLSAYALTVEEGTPLAVRDAAQTDYLPDDETVASMQAAVLAALPAAGFARYEIANFAKPGAACLHNIGYWRYRPYLGLGAAAVSTYRGRRWRTTLAPEVYAAEAAVGRFAAVEAEVLPADVRLGEFVFLGLRMVEGLSLQTVNRRFGIHFQTKFAEQISYLQQRGWAVLDHTHFRLTQEGMKWGNQAFSLFLPD